MTKSYKSNKSAAENRPKRPCVFCQQSHSPNECTRITATEERLSIIKQKRLCFNCFGNHKVTECRSRFTCRKCNKKHHSSLCDDNKKREWGNATTSTSKTQEATTAISTVDIEDNNTSTEVLYTSSSEIQQRTDVLLKTAIAPIWNCQRTASANILLDEGSHKSFISEELAKELNSKPRGTSTISLATFGDMSRNIRNLHTAVVELETQNGDKIQIEVLIVPNIAAPLQKPHQP